MLTNSKQSVKQLLLRDSRYHSNFEGTDAYDSGQYFHPDYEPVRLA